MPIPLMLAGLAAGILGVGGHLSAKETNEQAEQVADDAKRLYDDAKKDLEIAKRQAESSLVDLGYAKKDVLEGSMKQFLIAFGRVKNIEMKQSSGLNELTRFMIDEQGSLEMREMTNIYESTFASSAAGAATGAVIALAANGSLPFVTGALSTAGTALMMGEVGMAAGLAGSALSIGAAMTPLAAVAAPIVLFTGISSSMKADENLEKARTMYAQAKAAAEEMAVAETMCEGISERAEMFEELLEVLNDMFSRCTMLLDGVTRKKAGFISKKADFNKFTEDEKKLLAITRSLAGAVKAVIDTPILDDGGDVSDQSEEIFLMLGDKVEKFDEQVQYIESCNIKAKPVQLKPAKQKITQAKANKEVQNQVWDAVRNILALILAGGFMVGAFGLSGQSLLVTSLTFTASLLLLMNTQTEFKLFGWVKDMAHLTLIAELCVLLYEYAVTWTSNQYFWIADGLLLVASILILQAIYPVGYKKANNFKKLFGRIMIGTTLFSVCLPIFKVSLEWIGLSFYLSMIIIEILFILFAVAYIYENKKLDN